MRAKDAKMKIGLNNKKSCQGSYKVEQSFKEIPIHASS